VLVHALLMRIESSRKQEVHDFLGCAEKRLSARTDIYLVLEAARFAVEGGVRETTEEMSTTIIIIIIKMMIMKELLKRTVFYLNHDESTF